MRQFSDNVKLLIATGNIMPFYLVKMDFPGNTVRHTTLPYDVTVGSLGTFAADNGIISIETPKLSNVVDREAYKISYSDPTMSFRSLFDAGAVGVTVTVYTGFINTYGTTLNGVAAGAPMLDQNDIVIAYRGIIDTHTIVVNETVVVGIECSSPMADLDLVRTFYTDKNYARSISANDSAFDQVFEGSTVANLLWGKK